MAGFQNTILGNMGAQAAGTPLMAITFGKEELRDIRRHLQNQFFVKNYLQASSNISFYSILFSIIFRHPKVILDCLGKLIRTRRIDYIVETLNADTGG